MTAGEMVVVEPPAGLASGDRVRIEAGGATDPARGAERVPRPLFLDIALGHLRKRKRQTMVSILGVALGVGFFIGINALMRGFQQYFVSQIIDVAPHIVIKDEFRLALAAAGIRRLPDRSGHRQRGEAQGRAARHPQCRAPGSPRSRRIPGLAAAPTLQGQAILRYGTRDVPVSLYGIDPERERRVTNIEKDMIRGPARGPALDRQRADRRQRASPTGWAPCSATRSAWSRRAA